MAIARPLLSFLALFFLAGTVLFQFLVILSGAVEHSPENKFFFLQSTTDGIPTSMNPARWTFFALCGVNDKGHNANCEKTRPAFPFDPPNARNFGTNTGIPHDFIGTNHYFLMSRFMFVFYLIALFFAVVSLFTGLLALCTRIGAYLSALNAMIALFFQTITACLMTAWTVQARNAWNKTGRHARLGVKSAALTWTSVALLFLTTLLFCIAGATGKREKKHASAGRGVFRKRSEKNRGSFYETESQRRVRDSYS
ncbi:SUR7-domain-containing protein [Eremomyces bilateralis CBS 781.70]|uniref:SUR7-domain-containing protein n=1 Tax=Eremomyces bilateralis CBS 781.70 TaxID=1392243 RepID=A0A6G1FZE7_9PEZI|nr:SUR7-domain-containing protein [Eremomyces bilateralis CBS 781.70]KAF1811061.1 SUR7-domain-containing protein [Eremomyces bilateralis CBS 781.70]